MAACPARRCCLGYVIAMNIQDFKFETHRGLPPNEDQGLLLIEHEDHGGMLSRWNKHCEAWQGVAIIDVTHSLVGQHVLFRDEQLPLAVRWARLPLTGAEVDAELAGA